MSETSHFKVYVDGVKVKSFRLNRGESKYVPFHTPCAKILGPVLCLISHAGSFLDSRIKMTDIRSFSSLFLVLLMML